MSDESLKPLYPLFLKSKKKEALYLAFWLELGEKPGVIADVTFDDLRFLAERYGQKWSVGQVRRRVEALEALDVLAIAPRKRGRFDLFVYRPAPRKQEFAKIEENEQ